MYRGTRYFDWTTRFYGNVPFDLASSGMTALPLAELGPIEALDDPAAYVSYHRAIAAYHGVPEGEAIGALGTSHALWLVYATLLDAESDVLIEEPAYEPLLRAAEGTGARIVRFSRSPRANFAIDPAEVAAKITPRTRVVCVTNLHNPTGVRTGDAQLREVAQVAAKAGAHLLVDEVYAPFDDLVDGSNRWLGSARRLAPNVIAVGSLTKCYGLGAQRLGWVLASPDVIARIGATLLTTSGGLPASQAAIGAHALARVGDLAARAKRLLGSKRATVDAWVSARPDLVWSAPSSGLFGLVRVPGEAGLREAIERGVESHGVLVGAAEFFEIPDGFRLAWTIAEERLPEGLARLAEVIDPIRAARASG